MRQIHCLLSAEDHLRFKAAAKLSGEPMKDILHRLCIAETNRILDAATAPAKK